MMENTVEAGQWPENSTIFRIRIIILDPTKFNLDPDPQHYPKIRAGHTTT